MILQQLLGYVFNKSMDFPYSLLTPVVGSLGWFTGPSPKNKSMSNKLKAGPLMLFIKINSVVVKNNEALTRIFLTFHRHWFSKAHILQGSFSPNRVTILLDSKRYLLSQKLNKRVSVQHLFMHTNVQTGRTYLKRHSSLKFKMLVNLMM